MLRWFTVLFVFPLAIPCWAAEEAKPNTLTPKEIAEGWILLFDGETAFGWDTADKPAIQKGVFIHGGDRSVRVATTIRYFPCEVSFDCHLDKIAQDAAPVRVILDRTKRTLAAHEGWTSVKIQSLGASVLDRLSPPPLLVFDVPKGNKLSLWNVKLKPLAMKPLFNGKDLAGWKEYPGRKSKFTVTKEGWLSIKNGPGDLQTTAEWGDFMLQLECRTNGDHLNSGVFFRCIPGEYQNGYEAQIQNQHAPKPKTYTIEEYDPQTRKLVNKKKIENWSRDYGTGSIYRRVPARRAAAKDREWFTMTIAARGRRFATWVNGIQTADWTDNRPENDNARNGFRLKKGPISLQGHDPTTDLSFRNIRIAEQSRDR